MIKNKDLAAIKDGNVSVDALLEAYPVKALVSDLVELLKEAPIVKDKPIVVDEDDFKRIVGLFKIRGINTITGTAEHRGRPKGSVGKIKKG